MDQKRETKFRRKRQRTRVYVCNLHIALHIVRNFDENLEMRDEGSKYRLFPFYVVKITRPVITE